MRSKPVIAAMALLAAAAFSTAGAQQKQPPKELEMVARNLTAKEQADSAKRPADSLRAMIPGDLLEYRMVFTNVKDVELRNVTFDNPLPTGLTYNLGSAGANRADVLVEFSIDGAKSWSANPTIEVIENGEKVRRPAPPETYTHVRWRVTGGVAPGAKVVAQYRARAKGSAGTAPSRQVPVK